MNKVFGMILSHNCEKLLPITLNKIPKSYFNKIFVTDDGSSDNSPQVASELGLPITKASTSGYGANVKHGLNYAFNNGADYVVEIHGDGAQFNPNAIGLRFGTVNGHSERLRNELMVNSMAESSIKNGYLTMMNADKYRPILFIDELVECIIKILMSNISTGIFNITSINSKIKNIAEEVSKYLNSDIKYAPDQPTYNFMMSTKKFEDIFNYKFTGNIIKIIDSFNYNKLGNSNS